MVLTGITLATAAALLASEGELPGETPPVPWSGQDVLPAKVGEPTILFVNFEGAVLRSGCGNDPHFDCSTLADTFGGYVGPFSGNATQRAAIMEQVRKDLAPFGVTAVAHRPPLEVDYDMVLYGDLGPQGFAGVAPYIDCGNVWSSDTSFSQGFRSANQGSTVILQEAAHTWGLEHVNQPDDILHPITEGIAPSFVDACEKIVSNTSLDESSGVCNLVHSRFCEEGFQNSAAEMAYLFGPPVPDQDDPVVEIITPEQDAMYELPAFVSLRAEVSDNFDPQFYQVSVEVDGAEVFADERYDDVELAFQVNEPGEYEITVRVADEAGNTAQDTVQFSYVAEGELDPVLEPSACTVDSSRGPSGALWLLLLAAVPRRRR